MISRFHININNILVNSCGTTKNYKHKVDPKAGCHIDFRMGPAIYFIVLWNG